MHRPQNPALHQNHMYNHNLSDQSKVHNLQEEQSVICECLPREKRQAAQHLISSTWTSCSWLRSYLQSDILFIIIIIIVINNILVLYSCTLWQYCEPQSWQQTLLKLKLNWESECVSLDSPSHIIIHTGYNKLRTQQETVSESLKGVIEKASSTFSNSRVVISTLLPRKERIKPIELRERSCWLIKNSINITSLWGKTSHLPLEYQSYFRKAEVKLTAC